MTNGTAWPSCLMISCLKAGDWSSSMPYGSSEWETGTAPLGREIKERLGSPALSRRQCRERESAHSTLPHPALQQALSGRVSRLGTSTGRPRWWQPRCQSGSGVEQGDPSCPMTNSLREECWTYTALHQSAATGGRSALPAGQGGARWDQAAWSGSRSSRESAHRTQDRDDSGRRKGRRARTGGANRTKGREQPWAVYLKAPQQLGEIPGRKV